MTGTQPPRDRGSNAPRTTSAPCPDAPHAERHGCISTADHQGDHHCLCGARYAEQHPPIAPGSTGP